MIQPYVDIQNYMKVFNKISFKKELYNHMETMLSEGAEALYPETFEALMSAIYIIFL